MNITIIVPFTNEIRQDLQREGFEAIQGTFDGPEGTWPILAVPTTRHHLHYVQTIVANWDAEAEDLLVVNRRDNSVYLIPIEGKVYRIEDEDPQGKWVRKTEFSRGTQECHFHEANITYIVER